ncbi:hypothetical protein ABG82_11675 [Mycobacteroides immunogenum]|uniref:Uncharacterized protein n=1 Tax=Mycobacteroides immunogenum TaxID=83262 RepID=A0A7V8LNG0_9MYCO|nr:hypothetical protein ABG82_11675 [Mycobacteroides immunogenum]KIU38951.1 hypothetical protein TL11_19755 [Mycobacteroides immunogenum]KPG08969.1 hypothetical protein AN908_16220 [Mycobacteroides immunogenum]KPG09185.1 hypothetical protein AN909_12820 [Mycobacteroides immunogenum]KPG10360.1 hypothetical protein AN910_16225 [Mycobacteroides immunogenum]
MYCQFGLLEYWQPGPTYFQLGAGAGRRPPSPRQSRPPYRQPQLSNQLSGLTQPVTFPGPQGGGGEGYGPSKHTSAGAGVGCAEAVAAFMIATGAAMTLAANTACPSMMIFFIAQPPTLDAAVISQD